MNKKMIKGLGLLVIGSSIIGFTVASLDLPFSISYLGGAVWGLVVLILVNP